MKRLLTYTAALLFLALPQFVLGADVDELKALDEKITKAYNALDPAPIAAMIHPGAVMFTDDSVFATVAPMESTETILRAAVQQDFSAFESLTVIPVNMQYKVVGNTGIMWGYQTIVLKPKDGPRRSRQVRVTYTLIKSDGKWLLLMAHESAIPSRG